MLIEHTILGNDMQAVEVTLQPGQELVAEASTLLAMEEGITFFVDRKAMTQLEVVAAKSPCRPWSWFVSAFNRHTSPLQGSWAMLAR